MSRFLQNLQEIHIVIDTSARIFLILFLWLYIFLFIFYKINKLVAKFYRISTSNRYFVKTLVEVYLPDEISPRSSRQGDNLIKALQNEKIRYDIKRREELKRNEDIGIFHDDKKRYELYRRLKSTFSSGFGGKDSAGFGGSGGKIYGGATFLDTPVFNSSTHTGAYRTPDSNSARASSYRNYNYIPTPNSGYSNFRNYHWI